MLAISRNLMLALAIAAPTVVATDLHAADIDTLAMALGRDFLAKRGHVGLSIGISDKGVRKVFNVGSTERGRLIPPTSRTIYELASLTKSYTGMLLARAVTDHKLALADDVRHYLPSGCNQLSFGGHPIRIVDLANHTSGLPKNLPTFLPNATPEKLLAQYRDMSRERFLAAVCGTRLDRRPGSKFAYSNAGTQLLGIVLENVYGATYDVLIRRLITAPHHMPDTGTSIAPGMEARTARRYDGQGNPMPELSFWKTIPAAGFLKSTVDDQLRYLEWNLDESDPVVALAHRVTFSRTDERGDDIGLYWFVNRKNGKRLVRHAGGSFGSTSFALLYPDMKIGIMLLANDASASTEQALCDIADRLATALMASP